MKAQSSKVNGQKLGVNLAYDRKKAAGTISYSYCSHTPPFDCHETSYYQSNKESLLFFGPQLGFEYLQKDNFRLGSMVGVSVVLSNREDILDFHKEKESDTNLFFHAELINFTWGKTNGLTGQLGFGHKSYSAWVTSLGGELMIKQGCHQK